MNLSDITNPFIKYRPRPQEIFVEPKNETNFLRDFKDKSPEFLRTECITHEDHKSAITITYNIYRLKD